MYRTKSLVPAVPAAQIAISEHIWKEKYRYQTGGRICDPSVEDTFARVTEALLAQEPPAVRAVLEDRLTRALRTYTLLPAGRILAGAGTARNVTLSNTFVMPSIEDSLDGILDTVKTAAKTMQMGGGLGYDFSTIRPSGTVVAGLDCPAAGPLAAMDICDTVCKMVVSGMGRGAMMATLRCDHPDIEAFVTAKSDRSRFRNFNLSVLVTDAFMAAVAEDAEWELIWEGRVCKTLKARALWDMILRQTYEAAEPGVLFIDRINALNPLNYIEDISAANSCAEQPLPPNGTCPLASVNLSRLVRRPFSQHAYLDEEALRDVTALAVRMLDNVLDVSQFATDAQRHEAQSKRRIGIGVTGVADALILLDVRYGSAQAATLLARWMQILSNAAYRASALLAADRGAFPLFDATRHQAQPMLQRLDPDVRQLILRHGLRNGTLTSIAPTGTISMFAGNVSSGIEPVFAASYTRKMVGKAGMETMLVQDFALFQHEKIFGKGAPLPEAFVTAADLTPEDHIRMQAAAQTWVDAAISKTVNCPEDMSFDAFRDVYSMAYDSGCKGCTTFRPNAVTGSVLSAEA